MAINTEGFPIVEPVSEFRIIEPVFNVMGLKFDGWPIITTVFTGPMVSLKYCPTPVPVFSRITFSMFDTFPEPDELLNTFTIGSV